MRNRLWHTTAKSVYRFVCVIRGLALAQAYCPEVSARGSREVVEGSLRGGGVAMPLGGASQAAAYPVERGAFFWQKLPQSTR